MDEFLDFLTAVLAGRERGRAHGLGAPGTRNAAFVHRETGKVIADHHRIVRADDVRHVHREHGDAERERARGQLPVTKQDYARIPRIVDAAHAVALVGAAKAGKPQRLVYEAELDGHHYQYVETIHPRERQVALKSLRKW